MKAKDIMTTRVVTVTPHHSVRHAAQIMLDHGISGLPVTDDEGRLVGIVTEGDLLRRVELGSAGLVGAIRSPDRVRQQARDYIRSHSWKVGDLMTEHVITVEEETPVGRIAALMEERRVKRLPVMRNGRLAGIVSRANLLRAIAVAKLEAPVRGDDAIRRSVLARLGEVNELSDVSLGVIVSGGIAHLWGDVDSESTRQAANVVAEGVRGVTGVVDHLGLIAADDPAADRHGPRATGE
ncbi:CBS domain-containing protein [Chelativorans xinjiangense]|uniref:CBS domain-containing protein n=1 Tax=Chelativorans xinjiangense TaxID=2681485 RepID=UPI00135CA243|nr:CBS domain-containing protein [Chelativorans xinjiangense]